jgi:hypothetical protein
MTSILVIVLAAIACGGAPTPRDVTSSDTTTSDAITDDADRLEADLGPQARS